MVCYIHVAMTDSHFFIWILLLISALTGLDLIKDMGEGVSLSHALIELMIIAVCTAGVAIFIKQLQRQKKGLIHSLDEAREDLKYWKKKSSSLVQGLSKEIENQFNNWSLTKSEKDIALLLIKGFSTKEIASYRNTAEKTTRVQTSSIYKKARVANRNELAAFFLEDLLLPKQES